MKTLWASLIKETGMSGRFADFVIHDIDGKRNAKRKWDDKICRYVNNTPFVLYWAIRRPYMEIAKVFDVGKGCFDHKLLTKFCKMQNCSRDGDP